MSERVYVMELQFGEAGYVAFIARMKVREKLEQRCDDWGIRALGEPVWVGIHGQLEMLRIRTPLPVLYGGRSTGNARRGLARIVGKIPRDNTACLRCR